MHIGVQELVVILLIAAVVFGGGKLAGVGKALGKSIREFREEVKSEDGDTLKENKG